MKKYSHKNLWAWCPRKRKRTGIKFSDKRKLRRVTDQLVRMTFDEAYRVIHLKEKF